MESLLVSVYFVVYLDCIFVFVIQFNITAKVTLGFVMRNRSVSIIFGSLVLWAVATYFLFLDQQSVGKDQDKVKEKKMLQYITIYSKKMYSNNYIYIFVLILLG